MQVPQPFGENLPPRLEPRTYGPGTTTREMTPPGGRIQRHLDAENPSRFTITDPRNNATGRQGGGGDREKQSRREEGRRRLREKLAKVVSCGIPLDVCARVILTVGMLVSLLALLWSVNSLIRINPLPPFFSLSRLLDTRGELTEPGSIQKNANHPATLASFSPSSSYHGASSSAALVSGASSSCGVDGAAAPPPRTPSPSSGRSWPSSSSRLLSSGSTATLLSSPGKSLIAAA